MAIPIITPDNVVRFAIEGKATPEQIDRIYGDIRQTAKEHGQAHLLLEFLNFTGFSSFETAYSQVRQGLSSLQHIGRCAIISDEQWVEMTAEAENFLIPNVEIKVFDAVQRQTAIDWLVGKSAE